MKHSVIVVLSVAIALGAVSCSNVSSHHPAGTVQRDLYQLPEKGGERTFRTEVDATTVASVKNVLRIQNRAMDQLIPLPSLGQTSDWVPWHLDGMIASFGISVDGIFGALFSPGEASIKGTWVPKAASHALGTKIAKKPQSDLIVSAQTRVSDVSRQLEPALRALVRSGAIKNESVFRKNALTQAERFRELCQVFSTARFARGWKVEQYRLELGFEADGTIAGTEVGAAAHLRFDWNAPDNDDDAPLSAASTVVHSATAKSFKELLSILSEEINSATQEAGDIEIAGYGLDEVRVGIGISAEGDVGVAQASAYTMGSVTFSRDESVVTSQSEAKLVSPESVTLIGSSHDSSASRYAADFGIQQFNGVYQVDRENLRKGLVRAMKLGSWMTQMAASAPSDQWELSEVETEFDLSVSGTVGIATVEGTGALIMSFSKNEVK